VSPLLARSAPTKGLRFGGTCGRDKGEVGCIQATTRYIIYFKSNINTCISTLRRTTYVYSVDCMLNDQVSGVYRNGTA